MHMEPEEAVGAESEDYWFLVPRREAGQVAQTLWASVSFWGMRSLS